MSACLDGEVNAAEMTPERVLHLPLPKQLQTMQEFANK